MRHRVRSRQVLATFVMGATLLTGGSIPHPSYGAQIRRFLALPHVESPALVTVQATPSTEVIGSPNLLPGAQVRLAGSMRGNTLWATRIEILD